MILLAVGTAAVAAPTPPAALTGSEDGFDTPAVIDADAVAAFRPQTVRTSTAFATRELGEPTPSCGTADVPTVWFEWTAPTSSTVDISTMGPGEFDTVVESELAIWTGDSLDALVEVECSDTPADRVIGIGPRGRIYITPTAGTTYRIQVATPGEVGPVALTVRRLGPVGANDAFAEATPITSLPFDQDGGYILGATVETGEAEPSCLGADPMTRTLWWSWTPTTTQRVTFDTTLSQANTILAVYTGPTVDALVERACGTEQNARHFGDDGGRVSLNTVAGTTYWIQVTDQVHDGRPVQLQAWRTGPIPGNDDFADATPVDDFPYAESLDLTRATGETGEAGCGSGRTVWYALAPEVDTTYVISTLGSPTDTEIGVYTGDTLPTLTIEDCADDFGWQYQESVTYTATGGVTTWVQVGLNSSDEPGPAEVRIEEADEALHDTFDTAVEITAVPFLQATDGHLATPAMHCGGEYLPTWYRWTAPADMPVWVSTLGTESGTMGFEMFRGDTADTLVSDGCIFRDVDTYAEMQTFQATAGTTYSFAVLTDDDGFGYRGPGTMVLQLQAGASVSGTVTEDGTDAPIADLCVEVRDADGATVLGATTTDEQGDWVVGGMDIVDVTVAYNLCEEGQLPYVGEYYDDVAADGTPTVLGLGAGTETRGIDAALEPQIVVEPEPFMIRYQGDDRLLTAIEISKATFPTLPSPVRQASATDAQAVVIARANDYADALAGAPLARAAGAPILLSRTAGLEAPVEAEIQRLGVTTAYLLGGQAALSSQVEADLAALGVTTVERLGGADRFATAGLVADELGQVLGAAPTSALLVEGINTDALRGWPDAVSAGAAAARQGIPILLTRATALPTATATTIEDGGITDVTVVGGEAAVAGPVVDAVEALDGVASVQRTFGVDRFATSTELAGDELAALGGPVKVWIATGLAFPDALAAGPAVAAGGDVLVLAHGKDVDRGTATYDWLAANASSIDGVRVVGGVNAVSEAVADKVVDLVD